MNIFKDMKNIIIKLAQLEYLQKVMRNFNMAASKKVNTLIGEYFKLYSIEEDFELLDTNTVPNSSVVGIIMYSMVGSRPGLTYEIGYIKFL